MTQDPLRNPVWNALTTAHHALAGEHGLARRYHVHVAPFAALAEYTPAALADLLPLLAPAEGTSLVCEDRPPTLDGLQWIGSVPCLQMVFPQAAALPEPETPFPGIVPLSCEHADEMLALITLAFPGFFRQQTCRMGRYWGVRASDGTLVGMVGERLLIAPPGGPAWPEISGLCRHPTLAPKGVRTALLCHILARHRAEDSRSWLHVAESNTGAIALYHRLGFVTVRHIGVHRLQRVQP